MLFPQILHFKWCSFFVYLNPMFFFCLFDSPILCFCRGISDVLWEAISTRQVLSLYQGLGTKNLQSFLAQFVYFYGYSYFKKLYLERSGFNSIGTKANLILAAAAGACTAIVTQVRLTWGRPQAHMIWLRIISHLTYIHVIYQFLKNEKCYPLYAWVLNFATVQLGK